MKKFKWVLFIVFISLLLCSCENNKPIDIKDDDIVEEETNKYFKDNEIIIEKGEEVFIDLLHDLKYDEVDFFIEDENVIEIIDGKIIPKNVGTSKIWCEYNYISDELEVLVMPIVECDLCSEDEIIYVGTKTNLIVANFNGSFSDFEIFSSSDSVEINGNSVRFLEPADVDLVVAYKNDIRLNYRLSFRVRKAPPIIVCDSLVIDVDEYVKFDIDNYVSNDLFNFYVSDETILELDSDYYGLGLKPGKVTLTAKLKEDEEVSSSIEIIVRNIEIKANISNNRIIVGDKFNIDIYNYEGEGRFGFIFSNEGIITKIKEKEYQATSVGETTLTIYLKDDPNTKLEIFLVVYPKEPIINIGLSTLQVGQTAKLSLLNYIDLNEFDIEYSNNDLIEVNGTIICCKKRGSLVITVTKKDDKTITSSVTLNIIPIQPDVYLSNYAIKVGGTSGIYVSNLDDLMLEGLDNFDIKFTNLGIVNLEDNILTGLKEGETNLILTSKTDSEVKAEVKINVTKTSQVLDINNEPNEGVLLLSVISNPGAYLYAGDFYQIEIDGANNKENYRWISTDAKVATVNDSGRVIAVDKGVAQIAAINKLNGDVKGVINITVYGISNVDYAARLVRIATEEIGYREGPNNDTKYGAWYNLNYEAWCAMFVSWCCNQAGISTSIVPKYCGCTAGMNWFIEKGQFEYRENGYIPKAGDIIFFRDRDVLSWTSTHTGIVYAATKTTVYTIEGNTSDMCAKRSYNINSTYILGYGVPQYPEFEGTPATFTPGFPESGENHNTR